MDSEQGKKRTPRKRSQRSQKPQRPQRRKTSQRGRPQTSQRGRPQKSSSRPRTAKSPARKKRAYHLVINGGAGMYNLDDQMKLARMLERRLKKDGWDVEINGASNWDDYGQAVTSALRQRPFALIVFGGDGSVRFAASRVAKQKGLLGIVPTGRFNNIYTSLYGEADPEESLNMIRSEYQVKIDAGLANGRFFMGSMSFGLVPQMIEQLGKESLPRWTRSWVKLANKALAATPHGKFNLQVDAFTYEIEPTLFHIHMLPRLMSLPFAPVSTSDDGKLVLLYDDSEEKETLARYIRDLKKDKYQYATGVKMVRGERIKIKPGSGVTWLMDGDPVTFAGDFLSVEVLKGVLRIFSNAPAKKK